MLLWLYGHKNFLKKLQAALRDDLKKVLKQLFDKHITLFTEGDEAANPALLQCQTSDCTSLVRKTIRRDIFSDNPEPLHVECVDCKQLLTVDQQIAPMLDSLCPQTTKLITYEAGSNTDAKVPPGTTLPNSTASNFSLNILFHN